MLQKLHIRNYAIIAALDISFTQGLQIITGETGAGKSIVMGALQLILGSRADTNMLFDSTQKCVVEGIFTMQPSLAEILAIIEVDADDNEVVLRREIAANGKSRAFVNDTPVNLQQLRFIASALVDVHQQFDTLELGEQDFQREVIDALAVNGKLLQQYKNQYTAWRQAQQALTQLQQEQQQFKKEFDFNQFQYNELAEANFQPNELEDATAELDVLNNAESIKAALANVAYTFTEGEQPINATIKQLLQQLQQQQHPQLPVLTERLQAAYIELQDIASEVASLADDIVYDAARIEHLNERINIGYKLLKKHNLNHTNELLALQAELDKKLQAVLDIDEAILTQQQQVQALEQQCTTQALAISKARLAQAQPLSLAVNDLLKQVGMPNANIQVQIQPTTLQPHGSDTVTFLFDANKSGRYEPIAKVASGGELSRLMLCIKSLVAQKMNLPTLIFDEIDTGISGEAAKQVGTIMYQLAQGRQVICITHQPQIAAKAQQHLYVYKQAAANGAVTTNIKLLNTDESIKAIAQMLGGENPSEAALASAREMKALV
ncbi:MAG TPA: DNA repair protein RecN [Chitinophagaceae bacterium]|nr:DNA repair protein RecN [Chitinophagaceae bacterium]HAN37510.1 DNA repair protein RecN [Chitinophagaceae bacterium]